MECNLRRPCHGPQIDDTEYGRIVAVTVLKEDRAVVWRWVHKAHMYNAARWTMRQPWPGNRQSVSMHCDAQREQLQKHRTYLQNHASNKCTGAG